MGIRAAILNPTIYYAFRLLCRIESSGIRRVPLQGPGIIITNHTSNLEAPFLYVMFRPRHTTAIAKAELWKFFATRLLMQTWKVIPLHRDRIDRKAMSRSWQVLSDGNFLCLAPEGRRSKTGTLLRAQPGATYFAAERQVPIYPIAQWGCNEVVRNLLHLRRTPLHLVVGRPYVVRKPEGRLTGEQRQAMADEMMYQLASLMPAHLRGEYADLSKATTQYLEFLPE